MTDPKPRRTRKKATEATPATSPAIAAVNALDATLRGVLPDSPAREKALRKLAAARRAVEAALAGVAEA